MAWSSGTPYSTRVDGRRWVLSRPPSLEPSTPEVSEPTKKGRFEIKSVPIGYLRPEPLRSLHPWVSADGRNDGGGRPVVAQPAGVEHHVIVRGIEPIVVVDLADVGTPIGVHLLDPVPCFLVAETEPLAQSSYPIALRPPEEDVQGSGFVPQDVCPASTNDYRVARARSLLDHLLRDLQHRLAGVGGLIGVRRRPGCRLRRRGELDRGSAQRLEYTAHKAAGHLLVPLHLVLRQLEPAGHLLEDLRVDQLGPQPLCHHATDRLPARSIHPADGYHRHCI